MYYHFYHTPYGCDAIPTMTFNEAKAYFEAEFQKYYGQTVDTIDEDTSRYQCGAWVFNSPVWSSDGKTVTNYGNFRDRKQQEHQPIGAVFITAPNVIPVYPG